MVVDGCCAVTRTGLVPGELFRSPPLEAVDDLSAWDIPRHLWPAGLRLMTQHLEWTETLATKFQQEIMKAIEVMLSCHDISLAFSPGADCRLSYQP